MNFNEFLDKVHQTRALKQGRFRGRLLALDPGETTGWSVFDSHDNATKYELFESGQLETWNKEQHSIERCAWYFPKLLKQIQPDYVVLERYAVYSWKSEDHTWSDVPTLRIIGSIETRLIDQSIPYHMQTAQAAKNFATDQLLKEWGFWERGQRHARDSIRHALYFLTFGKP